MKIAERRSALPAQTAPALGGERRSAWRRKEVGVAIRNKRAAAANKRPIKSLRGECQHILGRKDGGLRRRCNTGSDHQLDRLPANRHPPLRKAEKNTSSKMRALRTVDATRRNNQTLAWRATHAVVRTDFTQQQACQARFNFVGNRFAKLCDQPSTIDDAEHQDADRRRFPVGTTKGLRQAQTNGIARQEMPQEQRRSTPGCRLVAERPGCCKGCFSPPLITRLVAKFAG